MGREAIGANVRRLRQAKGWTQRELAAAADLSLSAYRNIETRQTVPRADTLAAVAEALDVPVHTLVRPVPELQSVRFRSFKRLKTRRQILADVARWLEDFKTLEEALGERVPCTLIDVAAGGGGMSADPETAARRVRERFGLRPDEPVRDICGLLESNGIKVQTQQVASDAFFGLSVAAGDGGPAIVVNTWDRISVERWIFTAAHELGHLVLHLGDYDVGERDEGKEVERQANQFAAHFLMPDEVFRREWDETYGMGLVERVFKVKRIFRVSYKTVLYRLTEGKSDKAELWKRFQVAHRRRYGNTLLRDDEPRALAADAFRASTPESSRAGEPENLSPSDFVEDRLYLLVRRAVESEAITLSRGAEILGLSLAEVRDLSASWVA